VVKLIMWCSQEFWWGFGGGGRRLLQRASYHGTQLGERSTATSMLGIATSLNYFKQEAQILRTSCAALHFVLGRLSDMALSTMHLWPRTRTVVGLINERGIALHLTYEATKPAPFSDPSCAAEAETSNVQSPCSLRKATSHQVADSRTSTSLCCRPDVLRHTSYLSQRMALGLEGHLQLPCIIK